jgi:hypothetical protein
MSVIKIDNGRTNPENTNEKVLALIQNILSEELETKKNQMVELIARC